MNLHELTAHEIRDLIRDKQTTPAEVYRSVREIIQERDKNIRAYCKLFPSVEIPAHPEKDGHRIPIAVKDNICIKDFETTCCSHVLESFRPPYNATVIEKLNDFGALIVGHTNMDEFAFGSSTENSCFGPSRNPWNTDCVVGGSSGGSAAAVAAQEAVWALGSDTGGSIRQPAALCGVVGLKPTYGRVSRYGLIAFASSLDQIGPITKDVEDAAVLLNIIAGYDPMDSTSADLPVPDYVGALKTDAKGLKVGVPKEYFVEGLDKEVEGAAREALNTLKQKGAEIVDISLPHTEYAVATYYIVATAEASSNLARFDGVQYGMRRAASSRRRTPLIDMYEETRGMGFGQEVKRRVMLGTYALSSGYYDAYYLRAQKVRTLIKNDFDRAFRVVDAIVTPTTPTVAFRVGEKMDDPLAMYLSDVFTIPANLAGIPSISVPCGFSKSGLPIGLQVMAKPFDESTLMHAAYAYEQAAPWHKRRAAL